MHGVARLGMAQVSRRAFGGEGQSTTERRGEVLRLPLYDRVISAMPRSSNDAVAAGSMLADAEALSRRCGVDSAIGATVCGRDDAVRVGRTSAEVKASSRRRGLDMATMGD